MRWALGVPEAAVVRRLTAALQYLADAAAEARLAIVGACGDLLLIDRGMRRVDARPAIADAIRREREAVRRAAIGPGALLGEGPVSPNRLDAAVYARGMSRRGQGEQITIPGPDGRAREVFVPADAIRSLGRQLSPDVARADDVPSGGANRPMATRWVDADVHGRDGGFLNRDFRTDSYSCSVCGHRWSYNVLVMCRSLDDLDIVRRRVRVLVDVPSNHLLPHTRPSRDVRAPAHAKKLAEPSRSLPFYNPR